MDQAGERSRVKGRGATINPTGRYEAEKRESFDDGWWLQDDETGEKTTIAIDHSRSIIARNTSPDVPFDRSINPYRGCEHGCIYCFARPTHAWLGLSPGLDFETKLFAKPDAARLLRKELAKPGYRADLLALGANTDPYQPIERRLAITRSILEVLHECRHPVCIVTKSKLVLRDLDILAPMGREGLAQVMVSITTFDKELARSMEPRASAPGLRLETVRGLAAAGVPVGVLAAPMIPALNDCELETILHEAAKAGAVTAGYVVLRLPLEIKQLFTEWLKSHYPGKAQHVLSLMRQMRGGALYDPTFGRRQRGQGIYAEALARRFELACRRLGLNKDREKLDTDAFRPPAGQPQQLQLL